MDVSFAPRTDSASGRLPDKAARMAKANSRSADTDAYYKDLGKCMKEVMRVLDLSLEEFAYALKKDDRYIARQLTGEDRPQIEVVFAVERFRAPMVIALAQMSAGVETVTTISFKRTA